MRAEARPARARHDRVKLAGKIRKIEMAMTVDQHCSVALLLRGARFRLDIARKYRRRRAGSFDPAAMRCLPSRNAKLRSSAGTAKQVEEFRRPRSARKAEPGWQPGAEPPPSHRALWPVCAGSVLASAQGASPAK